MTTGYRRIFGANDIEPEPAELVAFLKERGYDAAGHFQGDDRGWFQAELPWQGAVVQLDRYLADEQGLRAELNTWAAWVETTEDTPHQTPLMQRLIATRQMIVFRDAPDLCWEQL